MQIAQLRQLTFVFFISYLLSACTFSPTTYDTAPLSEQRIIERLEQHYQTWKRVPYRYGGTSNKGIDCSAFVQNTYKAVFGINLPRATNQQAQQGKNITSKQRRPGDLVFFQTSRSYRHVGIYMGNDRFLHVSKSKGVVISKLSQSYWQRHYWKTTRPLGKYY